MIWLSFVHFYFLAQPISLAAALSKEKILIYSVQAQVCDTAVMVNGAIDGFLIPSTLLKPRARGPTAFTT